MTTPTSGYRDDLDARIHDLDEKTHMVAVDFPVAIDSYGTDFGPGAFEDGWRHQLPVMCTNHNQNSVIGRAVRAESLPAAHRVVGRFANFDDVPAARAAFSCIRDGIYPGFSFHYVDGKPEKHPTVRSAVRFRSARMIEFSPVLAPSIPGTKVVGIRSASGSSRSTLDRINEVQARGHLVSLGAALDRRHAENMAEIRRLGNGQLPFRVRSRCFDAVTRQAEREVEELQMLGVHIDRAIQHRRDLSERAL